MTPIITICILSLQEGNVFVSVCQSVSPWWGGPYVWPQMDLFKLVHLGTLTLVPAHPPNTSEPPPSPLQTCQTSFFVDPPQTFSNLFTWWPSHYPLSTERSSCFNSVVYSGKLWGSQLWKKQDLSFGCHSLKAVRYVLTICGCPCCNIIYKAEGDLRCLLGNNTSTHTETFARLLLWD